MIKNLLFTFIMTILLINISIFTACSQSQRELDVVGNEKVNKSVRMFEELYGKEIPENNIKYIRDNFNEPIFTSIVGEWEEARNVHLVEEARLILLVDYLNSEIEFINLGEPKEKVRGIGPIAIKNYLDSLKVAPVIEPLDYRMNKLMKTTHSMASSGPNAYGELPISSDPDKADVYFDKNKRGKTNATFVLPIGEYSLSIKKQGYHDYNEDIVVVEGENPPVDCVLKEK